MDLIFTVRAPRRVSVNLTIQYDKMLYLINDTPEHRRLIGKYIDVYHYPNGYIEPRALGAPLPYRTYDRLSHIDHGAIVDNKRLGHVLQVAQRVQQKRDDRRSRKVPGIEFNQRQFKEIPGKKSQRSLSHADLNEAIEALQPQPHTGDDDKSSSIVQTPGRQPKRQRRPITEPV